MKEGKTKGNRKGKERGEERRGGTAGIHTVSGKMARWTDRIQHANKLLTVPGPSEAQFLTGQVY